MMGRMYQALRPLAGLLFLHLLYSASPIRLSPTRVSSSHYRPRHTSRSLSVPDTRLTLTPILLEPALSIDGDNTILMGKVFASVPSRYRNGCGDDLNSGYTLSHPNVFPTVHSLMRFPFSFAKIASGLVPGRCSPSGPVGSRILGRV
jgi:hypothetical protein